MRRITVVLCVTAFIVLVAAFTGTASGHDVISTRLTWSKEISRIVFRHCAGCHNEGAPAMPLMTYAQVRPWAKAIKEEVLMRRMPPWGAMKGFRPLRDDPSLTQEEVDRIAQWVEGGAPEGDSKFLPAHPVPGSIAQTAYARVRLTDRLAKGTTVVGFAPAADAADARITAELPDGRILPLLWLYGYKGLWHRTFLFVDPVELPAGTRIRAEPAIPVEALTAIPKPAR